MRPKLGTVAVTCTLALASGVFLIPPSSAVGPGAALAGQLASTGAQVTTDDPGANPLTQVAPPVADAGPDQRVEEGSVVTLDGSGSVASNRPGLAPSEVASTLPGGTSIGAAITGLDPESAELVATGSIEIGQGQAATNTSIAFVLDVSGSAGTVVGCGGDANGDRRIGTVLDCQIEAALKLLDEIIASGTVEKVAVLRFNTSATALDLDPTAASANLVAPDADADGNGVRDVEQALRTLRLGGGTNFVPPARLACQLLASTGSPKLLTAFLSDGQAFDGSNLSTVLPCSPPVEFQAFAVGTGSSCDRGRAGIRLADMAALSGGACTDVPQVADLPDILPDIIGSRVTAVSYAVDGGAPVDISAGLGLPLDGPASLPVSFTLPADVAVGTHEVCLTVTASDAGGSADTTTCSELVKISGELVYEWRVVTADGPPILLAGGTTATPSFVVPDDGAYEIELTVGDGTGSTGTDSVRIAVDNADPTLSLSVGDAFAGGLTQIDGRLTDPGWVDGHTAVVDWGDGTSSDVVVTTAGAGWGTFVGSHVYAETGDFTVTATLTDGDGGTATATLGVVEVGNPVAVWANSTDDSAFAWSGGAGRIDGRIHSNGGLSVSGASKVLGETTYAGPFTADADRNTFSPPPAAVAVQPYPATWDVADFRPGGRVAAEVGDAYRDMSARCSAGTWHEVQGVLQPGVYYADCDIHLNGSQIGGSVTLVAEGSIRVSGSRPAFTPYLDGLLLLSGATGQRAIDVATSGSKFLGSVFAGAGEISLSGAGNQFYCGILGDRIRVTGKDLAVRGADCSRAESAAAPVLVPRLTAGVGVDAPAALPGETLGYDVTIANDGTTLVVPALVGFENADDVAATVTGWSLVLERRDAVTGEWEQLAPAGGTGLATTTVPNDFPGVTYAAGDDPVTGTVVEPGGWATWGTEAVVTLTPDQARLLLDPSLTAGVRTRVGFDLQPDRVQARKLFTFGRDFAADLRALGADALDVRTQVVLPDGESVLVTSAEEAALARVGPGESVLLEREHEVATPGPRRTGETDAGYRGRLLAADGSPLTTGAFALAAGGVGRLVAPFAHATADRELPVLGVSATGPREVTAGTTTDYDVRLGNLGSRDASAVVTTAIAGGEPLAVSGAPAVLTPGEVATATAPYPVPAGAIGPATVRSQVVWQDSRGSDYGPVGSDRVVERLAPASLQVTLTDALHVDVGGDGTVSPGDTIRYTLTVRNGGDVPLTGVAVSLPAAEATVLLADSATTPDGGTVTVADGVAAVVLPDIDGGAARRVTVDARVVDVLPAGVGQVTTQAVASAAGVPDVLSDDPVLPGAADATSTVVIVPTPALTAALVGALAVDADGDGVVSPGDTLRYSTTITSVGTLEVTGVRFELTPPAGTTLVAGSVVTSTGTVTAGPGVDVAVGTLAPYTEAVVDFRLRIDDDFPPGVGTVSVAGTVTSNDTEPIPTDDPTTVTVGDSSVVVIGGPGGVVGGGPGGLPENTGPLTSAVSLDSGTTLAQPTTVTAELSARDGTTITGWQVTVRTADGSGGVIVLGRGDGGGSTAEASAVVDPTVLANGAYTLSIVSTSSDGGTSVSNVDVLVDGGDYKPGRMTQGLVDHDIALAGLPLRVERGYDSFDKASGDFGIGWDSEIADFSIAPAAPLGLGGWSARSTSCALIFCRLEYTSSVPHYVTVVWPDGRVEAFDLVGANASSFFPSLAEARFVPRGGTGTTSTLQPVNDSSLFFPGDGNALGGGFGTGGLYDPTLFLLTDVAGTEYLIDRATGLRTVTDRNGNTLTFTRNGVRSSLGRSIVYTRDSLDRITEITSPAGTTSYRYDVAGDLVESVGLDGLGTTYTYDDAHNLTGISGPGGRSLGSIEYGPDGRVVAYVDGAGNRTEVSVDLSARQETVTDPTGRLLSIATYDEVGNLVREDAVADGRTRTTQWAYDGRRQIISQTDASGTVRLTRNSRGQVVTSTDQDGVTVRRTYDPAGNLVTQGVDGASNRLSWTYDTAGNLTSMTGEDGVRVDLTHTRGLVREIRRDGDVVGTYAYDSLGRMVSASAGGVERRVSYDEEGLETRITDGSGALLTEFVRDDLGRPVRVVDGEGRERAWTYGDLGEVLTQTDAAGAVTRFGYDDAQRLTSVEDRTGATRTLTYDRAGRVLTTSGPDRTTTFGYDGFGDLVSAVAPGVEITRQYDDAGRMTSETTSGSGAPGYTLEYEYSGFGDVTRLRTPWGTSTLTYDGRGQLDTLADSRSGTFDLDVDDAGRLTRLARPNGLVETNVYDTAGNLEQRSQSLGGADVSSVAYSYDTVGRLTTVADELGPERYTYDTEGRLSGVDYADGSPFDDESFSYSLTGDRSAWTGHPAGEVSYDPAGRLVRDAERTYAYDAEGRLVTRTDRATGAVGTFVWNADHTLRSITEAGRTTTYGYDAFGRRVSSATDDVTTSWAYSGSAVVAELDGVGPAATVRQSFTVIPSSGVPLAATSVTGTDVYPVTDRLGSVTALTDASGAEISRTRYSAFGEAATQSARPGLDGVYSYTDHATDPTGLVYARARMYDPSIGRFLSEDPVQGVNLYAYVDNDPLRWTDPSGAVAAAEYTLISSRNGVQVYGPVSLVGNAVARSYAATVARMVNAVLQSNFRSSLWLSQAERAAFQAAAQSRNFPLMNKFVGQAVHRATADALRRSGSSGVYRTLGPDFQFVTSGGRYFVELTTRSQVAVKYAKGKEYAEAFVVVYRWPGLVF